MSELNIKDSENTPYIGVTCKLRSKRNPDEEKKTCPNFLQKKKKYWKKVTDIHILSYIYATINTHIYTIDKLYIMSLYIHKLRSQSSNS